MRDYPTLGDEGKNPVAVHAPSASWSLVARLAQSWWRNPNARGIAEPDPRTVARGRRAARALRSPCPYSKRRGKRERQLHAYVHQVGALLTKLAQLANVWPDPAHAHSLMRALTEAEARGTWFLSDPTWRQRTYERSAPIYLPRRADPDATRFIRAFRDARRFVGFAERLLQRERDDRLRSLVASLRPSAAPDREPITRRPDERKDIDPHRQQPAAAEDWRLVAERIAARIAGERPRDAM